MAVFRKTKHRTWLAWLGIFAMCLTIGMPVVSQLLPHRAGTMDMGGWCTPHGLSDHHRQGPSTPSSPLDKCGYCSLFCHSPLALGDAVLTLPPRQLPAAVSFEPMVSAGPPARVLSARPRGPPALA